MFMKTAEIEDQKDKKKKKKQRTEEELTQMPRMMQIDEKFGEKTAEGGGFGCFLR